MHRLSITVVRSEALFVSALQRSDGPSEDEVREAVTHAVREFGSRGCAARVAQEFGDHPETAVARMRWARGVVEVTFGAPHAAPVHLQFARAGAVTAVTAVTNAPAPVTNAPALAACAAAHAACAA